MINLHLFFLIHYKKLFQIYSVVRSLFYFFLSLDYSFFSKALLDAGASLDTETPSPSSPHFLAVNGENQHWTALTYAAAKGHVRCARILLERGANVEGGAVASEEKITLTPLQVGMC